MLVTVWMATLLFGAAGTWLVMTRLNRETDRRVPASLEGISVLKPLCGWDSGLEANLESFFRQEHPCFELLFSVADAADPAASAVKELQRRYPLVRARLFVGAEVAGPNPKVNNMIRTYAAAVYDQILISDSNVRVLPAYLHEVQAELGAGVGVVTAAVAGVHAHGLGGRLEATYLNTFYARGMHLAFATGNPCVIGKSMLFRRSVAEKFGGLRALAGYLAEDYALGEEMRRLGLEVRLMERAVRQHIGDYSFRTFWRRHIRWGRIRKAHAPVAFLLEPLSMPLLGSALAAAALGSGGAFAVNLVAWLGLDLLLLRRLGGGLEARAPLDWLLREALALPLWIAAGIGSTVSWRGHRIRILPGGRILEEGGTECSSHSSGARLPARTRWRATIRPATGGAGSTTAI